MPAFEVGLCRWHFSQWARCVSSIITSSGAQAAPGAVATGDLCCGFISCWKTALGDLRLRWPWETMGNHGFMQPTLQISSPTEAPALPAAAQVGCHWIDVPKMGTWQSNMTATVVDCARLQSPKKHKAGFSWTLSLCSVGFKWLDTAKSLRADRPVFSIASACQRDLASIGLVKGFSMYSETLHSRMQLFSNQVNKIYPPTGETRPPSCCATCRTSAPQPIKWYPDRTWSKENRLFQLSAVISEHESHGCMNLFVNIRL